ncbi:hypothetical protein LguiA_014946 [Lonicera macranthoides]
MAQSFSFASLFSFVSLTLSILVNYGYASSSCYSSILSFGDSLADTGNLLHLSADSNKHYHFALPPYGETYFHGPTGRCSDGRLIIDFIAEDLGLPYVTPYIGSNNFGKGVNFAVVGATALDSSFYAERGIKNPFTNASLGVQLGWFKKMLPSPCHTSSDCKELLGNSLVLMGEIGGNDYNHALLADKLLDEIQTFVNPVINAIAVTINELIKHGATTLMVPGNLPIGCSAAYLTKYNSSNEEDYDPVTGCLIKFNKFAQYHNEMLQLELNQLRELHPEVTIIYADYYNAAMQFYSAPEKYGFIKGALTACCGGGGPYNYNPSVACGTRPATVCEKPSTYANWDGLHLTEAAYKIIFKGLFEGLYTTPQINSLCGSVAVA